MNENTFSNCVRAFADDPEVFLLSLSIEELVSLKDSVEREIEARNSGFYLKEDF